MFGQNTKKKIIPYRKFQNGWLFTKDAYKEIEGSAKMGCSICSTVIDHFEFSVSWYFLDIQYVTDIFKAHLKKTGIIHQIMNSGDLNIIGISYGNTKCTGEFQ